MVRAGIAIDKRASAANSATRLFGLRVLEADEAGRIFAVIDWLRNLGAMWHRARSVSFPAFELTPSGLTRSADGEPLLGRGGIDFAVTKLASIGAPL